MVNSGHYTEEFLSILDETEDDVKKDLQHRCLCHFSESSHSQLKFLFISLFDKTKIPDNFQKEALQIISTFIMKRIGKLF